MQKHFTPPHITKPRVARVKIDKQYTSIGEPKKTAQVNVASWWDYLLSCDNSTRTDRNAIYWKYKEAFDTIGGHSSDILTFKYEHLPDGVKRVLTTIYKKEIK
jgi:hypothetical protein